MNFRTIISINQAQHLITHENKIQLFGSCFVENIGNIMSESKFNIDLNPFGILYNPISIANAINDLINQRKFTENDLFQHAGLYNSFSHHSRFSHSESDACVNKINEKIKYSSKFLVESDYLIVTFGTSFVYYLKESNHVVSNCHKLPERNFVRRRVTVGEVVDCWNDILEKLAVVNPNIKIIFTVSPIRHWKDGAHQNQLSKSTLLLAIDSLLETHTNTSYFPSYEIVMDELRDYRFYADDMIHPTETAVKYIWERFSSTYLSDRTRQIMNEWTKLRKALTHRPLNPDSDDYKHFLMQNLLKLKAFQEKYPYFELTNEIITLQQQLDKLH